MTRWLFAALALLGTIAWSTSGFAHPMQFGALNVRERTQGSVLVEFRFSGTEEQPADAHVVLPARCRDVEPPHDERDAIGLFHASRSHCDGGLAGGRISVDGLRDCQVLLTLTRTDGSNVRAVLDREHPAFVVPAPGAPSRIATRYVLLGIEHILTGADHLAFVAALMLLVRTRRRLFATITAFTAGHSVTLAAATLGLVHVSSAPVEASIALSIVLVANEIAHPEHDSLSRRQPWLVAALFGLLHGLGFAGALSSVGLPRGEIPLALACFNGGVELGQIAFVLVALVVARIALRLPRVHPIALQRATVYAIGSLAMYWVIDRVVLLAH